MSDIRSAPVPLKDGETEPLTTEESARLKELEGSLDNGSRKAGEALKEIKDRRLYRAEYRSFEEYWALIVDKRVVHEVLE